DVSGCTEGDRRLVGTSNKMRMSWFCGEGARPDLLPGHAKTCVHAQARFAPSWRSTAPATGPASRLQSLVPAHFVRTLLGVSSPRAPPLLTKALRAQRFFHFFAGTDALMKRRYMRITRQRNLHRKHSEEYESLAIASFELRFYARYIIC